MALKRLSTEEMVQLSASWVTEGSEVRKAIVAVPELSAVIGRVEAAHTALHTMQRSRQDSRLSKLAAEAAEEDLAHDTAVRGIVSFLSGLALLSDEKTAEELSDLQAVLFPDGLSLVQKSYRAEAGAGELLRTRLEAEPSIRKRLKEIPVLRKTLAQMVDSLLARAKRLGELENERAAIEAAVADAIDGNKITAARNQWIRSVNALIANAELAELDDKTQALLFGALRLAEKKADQRGKSPSEPAALPAPAPEKPD